MNSGTGWIVKELLYGLNYTLIYIHSTTAILNSLETDETVITVVPTSPFSVREENKQAYLKF